MQKLQPLLRHVYIQVGHARQIAAGSVHTGDKPNLDRVNRDREDDRNGHSRCFGRYAEGVPPPATITAT